MTNVMRGRWDIGANPKGLVRLAVDAATVVEIGDLIFLDGDDGKPFSHANGWTGTEAGSAGKMAEKFAGVAQSAHAANDAAVTEITVATRGTFGFPIGTGATVEVGNLVCADKQAAANLLEDQQVEKTTNESLAIGRVQRRAVLAAGDIVHVEITTKLAAGGGNRTLLTS